MLPLKVNETKVTFRKSFIENVLTLQSEKNQNMKKGNSFYTNRLLFTWLLIIRRRMAEIYGFLDFFNFGNFFGTFYHFYTRRLDSLTPGLNFG